MASGNYPLDAKYEEGGKALAELSDRLKWLLDNCHSYGCSPLPSPSDNDQFDNAASDGAYQTYLYLAHELIERCIKREA